MNWKKVSIEDTNKKNPLYYPKAFSVGETCTCCGNPLEVSQHTYRIPFKSVAIPSKTYQMLSNLATCPICDQSLLEKHQHRFYLSFDEETQSWINQDRWYEKQEWKSLKEHTN